MALYFIIPDFQHGGDDNSTFVRSTRVRDALDYASEHIIGDFSRSLLFELVAPEPRDAISGDKFWRVMEFSESQSDAPTGVLQWELIPTTWWKAISQ